MSTLSPDQFRYAEHGPDPYEDPLRATMFLSRLTAYNQQGIGQPLPESTQGLIVAELSDVVEYGSGLDNGAFSESGVAVRALSDLDLGMSSVRVFEKDPFSRIPELAQLMMRLSVIAEDVDGAPQGIYRVPLDYYVQPRLMPDGKPAMFTGTEAEERFLSSLNVSYFAMLEAANALTTVTFEREEPRDILDRLEAAAERLDVVFSPMMASFKKYLVDYKDNGNSFAVAHRPFFDPVRFGTKQLDAASAAQSPLEEIEAALRGIDGNPQENGGSVEMFNKFFNHNVGYMPLPRRATLDSFADRNEHTSYFTHIRNMEPSRDKVLLATAYLEVMGLIVRQRKAHNGATARDFRNRPDGSRGGAGFDPSDLNKLEAESQENLDGMQAILDATKQKLGIAA